MRPCNDNDPCTDDVCVVDERRCDHPAKTCAENETCDSATGECVGTECNDPGDCGECAGDTMGWTCDRGVCIPRNDMRPCNDNDLCTDDVCIVDERRCDHPAISCPDGEECNPNSGNCERICSCNGRECGDDGCGGSCGECAADQICTPEGYCESICVRSCTGKQCGDDGCGNPCPPGCSEGEVCTDDGQCVAVPACGDGFCDPASENCENCSLDCGECPCEPRACNPDECGDVDDGCGGTMYCGECPCEPRGCDPDECGDVDDGCGGTMYCGECPCEPDCEGKSCGDDGCEGSCGECAENETCTSDGQCECEPDCDGKQCGDDGCGGSCGSCPCEGATADAFAARGFNAAAVMAAFADSGPCEGGCMPNGQCKPAPGHGEFDLTCTWKAADIGSGNLSCDGAKLVCKTGRVKENEQKGACSVQGQVPMDKSTCANSAEANAQDEYTNTYGNAEECQGVLRDSMQGAIDWCKGQATSKTTTEKGECRCT